MKKRKLRLKKITVRDLDEGSLSKVEGATNQDSWCAGCPSDPSTDCYPQCGQSGNTGCFTDPCTTWTGPCC
jgi:hypothetical protein